MKASVHEDNKPLGLWAFYKREGYVSFFSFFLYLYILIANKFLGQMVRPDWKSKHPDGSSEWLNFLGLNKDDVKLRELAKEICEERAISKNMNFFPSIQSIDNSDENVAKVNSSLPPEIVTDVYLSFFFKTVCPLRPNVDDEDFMTEINRIIAYDSIILVSSLNISVRSDMANVAILFMILRYSSVALSMMKESNIEDKYTHLTNHLSNLRCIH